MALFGVLVGVVMAVGPVDAADVSASSTLAATPAAVSSSPLSAAIVSTNSVATPILVPAPTVTSSPLSVAIAAAAAPAAPAPASPLKLSAWLAAMTMSGDLRLRDEYFDYRDGNTDPHFKSGTIPADYNRERVRLRLKDEFRLRDDLLAVAALATGSGQGVSTNQTFGGLDQQAPIWIDLAYAAWTPTCCGLTFGLTGGRMLNPIWRVYSSDVVFDPDLNPYGTAESVTGKFGPGCSAFVVALQHAVDNHKTPEDQSPYELVEQAGVEGPLGSVGRLKVAVADHCWTNLHDGTLNQNPVQTGNTRLTSTNTPTGGAAAGTLLDAYNVGELTGQLSLDLPQPFMAGTVPLALQGTVIRNFAARGPDFQGWIAGKFYDGPGRGTSPFLGYSANGYQLGGILGKVGGPGTWEVAYFWKRVQWDATVADEADSDFGDPNGGLNRRGHVAWIGYTPNGFVTFQVKGYMTWILDQQYDVVNAGMQSINLANKINRIQADVIVKF